MSKPPARVELEKQLANLTTEYAPHRIRTMSDTQIKKLIQSKGGVLPLTLQNLKSHSKSDSSLTLNRFKKSPRGDHTFTPSPEGILDYYLENFVEQDKGFLLHSSASKLLVEENGFDQELKNVASLILQLGGIHHEEDIGEEKQNEIDNGALYDEADIIALDEAELEFLDKYAPKCNPLLEAIRIQKDIVEKLHVLLKKRLKAFESIEDPIASIPLPFQDKTKDLQDFEELQQKKLGFLKECTQIDFAHPIFIESKFHV